MDTDLASILIAWAPLLALIVVWIVMSRRFSKGPLGQIGAQYPIQLSEMQRTNVLLERIAVALEKRVGG